MRFAAARPDGKRMASSAMRNKNGPPTGGLFRFVVPSPAANVEPMSRKPMELPSELARRFVENYFAETDGIKRRVGRS